MRGRVRTLLAISGALAAGAAVYGVATAGTTGTTDARLTSYFAVLARPHTTADDLPSSASDGATAIGNGADASGARLATRSAGGASVFVIPGADGVCLSAVDGAAVGSTCAPTFAAIANGVVLLNACTPGLTSPDGGTKTRVTALIPNGVLEVTLALPGSARTAPVANNVVVWESDQVPSEISWTDGGRAVTVPVPGAGTTSGLRCAAAPDPVDQGKDAP
jgi:hypothetical protein